MISRYSGSTFFSLTTGDRLPKGGRQPDGVRNTDDWTIWTIFFILLVLLFSYYSFFFVLKREEKRVVLVRE
jgi:hypothetical protein